LRGARGADGNELELLEGKMADDGRGTLVRLPSVKGLVSDPLAFEPFPFVPALAPVVRPMMATVGVDVTAARKAGESGSEVARCRPLGAGVVAVMMRGTARGVGGAAAAGGLTDAPVGSAVVPASLMRSAKAHRLSKGGLGLGFGPAWQSGHGPLNLKTPLLALAFSASAAPI
jgi:hypothetical protein